MDPLQARTKRSSNATALRPSRSGSTKLLLAGSLALPLAFGLVFAGAGFFAVFPPVVIVSTVAALVAVGVLLVDRRWMTIVGAIAGLVVLAMGATDPTPGAMTRPSLGLQMSWGHAARLAGIVGLVAGIVAFREAVGRAPRAVARALPSVAAVALGLAVGIGAATAAALVDPGFLQGGTVVALEPDATVRLVEAKNVFGPPSAPVGPGQLVRIVVENRDDALHSFTTGDLAIDVDNLGARTTEILARAPAEAGDWSFFCKYHGGMAGVIRVA